MAAAINDVVNSDLVLGAQRREALAAFEIDVVARLSVAGLTIPFVTVQTRFP